MGTAQHSPQHALPPDSRACIHTPACNASPKVGRCLADFSGLSEAQWASVTVLLNCGVGENAGKKADVQQIWPKLTNLKWMHSSSAGLEHLLFPELVNSPVVLTNAKGVYSNSLAEFALMACKYFAMDVPRLLRAKAAKTWEPYDVEELRGRTLGVIGLGDIGKATAKLAATGYQMRVLGLRRSTALVGDEGTYVVGGVGGGWPAYHACARHGAF
jgi:hypothetical protein